MPSQHRTPPAATSGTWSPSPSPSPPPSPSFELSDADRLRLLSTHGPFKPSSLDAKGAAKGKSPLLVLSPEELAEKVANEKTEWADGDEDVPRTWEQVADAVLWTIPFGFLYSGLDYAVHAQFGQTLHLRDEAGRVLNIVPTIFFLTLLATYRHPSPPSNPVIPPLLVQFLLLGLCVSTGVSLVHLTSTESYLKVMRSAPGIGVLWVWSVVRLDLLWAVGGLLAVAVGVWLRGEAGMVKLW